MKKASDNQAIFAMKFGSFSSKITISKSLACSRKRSTKDVRNVSIVLKVASSSACSEKLPRAISKMRLSCFLCSSDIWRLGFIFQILENSFFINPLWD
jgi:hypothetical protein